MGIEKIPEALGKIKFLDSFRGVEAVRKVDCVVQAWDASDGSGGRLDAVSAKVKELGGELVRDDIVRAFGDEAEYTKEEQGVNYDSNGVTLREFKLPSDETADQVFELIQGTWKQDEINVKESDGVAEEKQY